MDYELIGGIKQQQIKSKRVRSSAVSIHPKEKIKQNILDFQIQILESKIEKVKHKIGQLEKQEKILKRQKTKRQKTKRQKTKRQKTSPLSQDFTASVAKLSLGKVTTVKAAIWGHGGQGTHRNIFKPVENMQLNIFGLALCNERTVIYPELLRVLDEAMKTEEWPPQPGAFESTYDLVYPMLSPAMKKVVIPKGNIKFEYNQDYGRVTELQKAKAEKFYTGVPRHDANTEVFGMKKKPLLRIYEIMHDGKNILKKPYDIWLSEISSLTDIMNTISSTLGTLGLQTNRIVVELLDNTCNSTIDKNPPTIGTIGTKNIPSVSK